MTWLAVGFLAQLMFSMRFIVQWIASERARRSIVPETFWYFSLVGRRDAVRLCDLPARSGVHAGPGHGTADLRPHHDLIRTHQRSEALAAAKGGSGLRPEQPAGRTG